LLLDADAGDVMALAKVAQATFGRAAVCPNKIFFPASVTAGRVEYGSPFA
jgi:hypothetical protein